jgi:methionyl aminopeptidase
MAYTKSKKEVQYIIEGGKIVGEILDKLAKMVKPGVSTLEIDTEAERLIREAGGIPAFKGYKIPGHVPFPGTICASTNTEVVHGIPSSDKILRDGDVFTMDIGMQWPTGKEEGKNGNGYFTDTALTVPVGEIAEKTKQLLNVTKKSLELAIEQCHVGNTIADIGRAVEDYVEPQGYGIVTDLAGHGVGHDVHEEPYVPNYYSKDMEQWKLRDGVVIAIEPMITEGSPDVETSKDGWSVVSSDGKLNAHYEHTVVITEDGPIVATRRPSEM